jgi:hypothetical protein
MATPRDRRDKLSGQTALNGIDFVEIADAAQTVLVVHFLNVLPELAGSVSAARIDGGETIATVAVPPPTAADWSHDPAGRPLLTLRVAAPGDFSPYTLTLDSPLLDPYLARVGFSFKAGCPSDLDCDPPAPPCPPPAGDPPPIDYLAKDFASFRKALLDFSTLRYPDWQERSEADFGVMFAEALASLADDLSYLQDRVAAEAFLDTATERRSLVRLARLVDYEPLPPTAARTVLHFTVPQGTAQIPAGLRVGAASPDGTPIDFETGTGLEDLANYPVNHLWNSLVPYWWDDADRCLLAGATEMWVEGSGLGLVSGQRILIDTTAAFPPDPPLRELVHLVSADEATDALYGQTVTRLVWRAEDKLAQNHDLTRTVVAANLVPATHGRRWRDVFAIVAAPAGQQQMKLAVARTGPNHTPQYLHTLATAPLAWLAADDPAERPRPELRVEQTDVFPRRRWQWRRSLLDAELYDAAFTVDPVRYAAIDPARAATLAEYDGDGGDTIRFGDGSFGDVPDDGTVFSVTYRVGGGTIGNVAAETLTAVDPESPLAGQVSVTNPFAAAGGADPEPDGRVRELAPQAFRARPLRAVIAADYQAAAETLPWVQRAGTSFRWTGSWLTVFTAVDPLGSEVLPPRRRTEVTRLLDRRRLAGYESYVPAPRYASLDLVVTVCARPEAFAGDVLRAVLEALDATVHADGRRGFFHVDNFTFGTALERSALEAAVQEAYGVDGVLAIQVRRRGVHGFQPMAETIAVARGEIVRVDNDPSRPERGSLRVVVEGGK